MRCPRCGCQEDKVIDSRSAKDGAAVRRRRECLSCGHRFTTHEEIIQAELRVVKRGGTREDFDSGKVRTGIEKACWKRNIRAEDIDTLVTGVLQQIEATYEREVPSNAIGRIIMNALKKFDGVAYIRFASIYLDFQAVDQFINEIASIVPENTEK